MSVREHDEQIMTELQQLRKSIEKVKVSREVAEALGKIVAQLGMNQFVAQHIRTIDTGNAWVDGYPRLKVLDTIGIDEMMQIARFGYEVEQTPEEKILKWYREQQHIWGYHLDGEVEAKITVEAIEKTLKILGVKVEGVNE